MKIILNILLFIIAAAIIAWQLAEYKVCGEDARNSIFNNCGTKTP